MDWLLLVMLPAVIYAFCGDVIVNYFKGEKQC